MDVIPNYTPMVYNRHMGNEPEDAIYVGRPSIWGNPFTARSEVQRNKVCDQFEEYAMTKLLQDPEWLRPLQGKSLVCWCAPKRCHADTLYRLANSPDWTVEGYFDGICEPAFAGGPRNPGGVAAGGWVVNQNNFWWPFMKRPLTGHEVYASGPDATNNVAEYEAALSCLRSIYSAKWRGNVRLYGDSQLVVNQFSGRYRCNSPRLRELREHLCHAASFFASVELEWIPREQNTLADNQSRLAYYEYRAT